jgi:hypothetical protein
MYEAAQGALKHSIRVLEEGKFDPFDGSSQT